MAFDKELIAGKLRRWEKYLHDYKLPTWEQLPDFGLYMEQVIVLLSKYLDYLPPELKKDQFITASTINNYVRKKIMPEPKNKKYYRIHIAYLIMICSLKQCLNITTLQTLIPVDLSEREVHAIYKTYVERHHRASEYFVEQVRLAAGGILDHEFTTDMATGETAELVFSTAVVGGFCRLLSEKLLLLDGKTVENGGSIEIN